LPGDTHPLACFANRSFEHIPNAEFPTDLLIAVDRELADWRGGLHRRRLRERTTAAVLRAGEVVDPDERDVFGIMDEPPIAGHAYAALAPKVDADGNDIDGLRNTNNAGAARHLLGMEHPQGRVQRGRFLRPDGSLHPVLRHQGPA
jgi:hypothetical protein